MQPDHQLLDLCGGASFPLRDLGDCPLGKGGMTASGRPTARGRFGDLPDTTPEEHQQRGDAAEALFRELTRARARHEATTATLPELRQRSAAHAGRGMLEQFSAFPSWFMRIECDRCGKVQMVNESHAPKWRDRMLRDIHSKMRHDGCGGLAAKAELLTGVEVCPAGWCGVSYCWSEG